MLEESNDITMKPNLFSIIPSCLFILLTFCSTTKNILVGKATISKADYQKLNWQERLDYISKDLNSNDSKAKEIIHISLTGKAVERAAIIDKLAHDNNNNYKASVMQNAGYASNIVRWKSIRYLTAFEPDDKDLNLLAKHFNDEEWLVRETAFKSIRRYPLEKINKTLFFKVLLSLNEKNSKVLQQIYQTLRWYNDERAFPYLYKRSFFTKNTVELLYIMRELSYYKNRRVIRRLRQIERKHPKAIRNTARQLLDDF